MGNILGFSADDKDNNERARIKYLYSIDIESIIADIKSSEFYEEFSKDPLDTQKSEAMMYWLYDEIVSACDLYTAFLNPSMPSVSHFGYYQEGSNCDKTIYIYRHFLNLCLRNHCIINDFNKRLPHNECNKLNFRQEFRNRAGYFDSPSTPGDYSHNSSQFYNYHKNRLNSEESLYSVEVLKDMILPNDYKGGPNCLAPYMAVCDYLYTNNEVNYLDKQLSEEGSESIWGKYSYLEQDYGYRIEGYITSIPNYNASSSGITYNDAFRQKMSNFILFTAPMEFIYGFRSFHYIAKLLNQLQEANASADGSLCLKDLDGSILFTISSMMLKCPLIYTRHFFMDYALYCLFNSKDLESSYLTQNSKSGLYKYPSYNNSSKATQLSKVLSLTRQFFDTLSNITVPLLEDMWYACTTELMEPIIAQSTDMVSFYKRYIDDNFLLLTGDFSVFSVEELDSFILRSPYEDAVNPSKVINKGIISHNLDLDGLKNSFCISQQHYQRYIDGDIARKERTFKEKLKQRSDPSIEKNTIIENYDEFPYYMEVPNHYIEDINRLLKDFLSTDDYRFKKSPYLHGYVNHIYSKMRDSKFMSSYEFAFSDYSRESLRRSIELYGENDNRD